MLKNICDAHNKRMEDLTVDEIEYLFATNNFYGSEKEYCYIHEAEPGYFKSYIIMVILLKRQMGMFLRIVCNNTKNSAWVV